MTRIEVGARLRGKDFKSGQSARGLWEMVHVTDDKDNCEITCWINNCPSGFEKGDGYFIVNNIRQVKYGKRKSKTTDKWFDSIDVELDISPCKPDTSFDDAMSDTDVPFEVGRFETGTGEPGKDPWEDVTTQEKLPWDDVY